MYLKALLLATLALSTQLYVSAPRIAGETLSTEVTSEAFGGFNGLSATSTDAECLLSAQCTLPSPQILCADYSIGGCDSGSEMFDSEASDLPMGCGIDSPGNECTLSQPYVCATIYGCYVNPFTNECEADFLDLQQTIAGARVCSDTNP